MEKLLKLLCSIPIILLLLYYIPFLGIILILFRYYVYRNKKYYSLPIYLISCGLFLLLPRLLSFVVKTFKLNINISEFISSDLYLKLISFSKFLITVGIIFLFLSYIIRNLIAKFVSQLKNSAKGYINKYEQEQNRIREKNDLIVRERKEAAENTHLVCCPTCGLNNLIVGKVGKCKSCRNQISYKE